jgi:thiamine pyrophosphokinase
MISKVPGQNIAVVIANAPGQLSASESELIRQADLVLAADAGLHKLKEFGESVTVIGDFDSIDDSIASSFAALERVPRLEQDSNDLEKSVAYAVERGASSVSILGGFGGRLDQSLTTLSVMVRYHTELEIMLYHDSSVSVILSEATSSNDWSRVGFPAMSQLSIVPWGNEAEISLKDVEWPLDRATLGSGSRGVSNRIHGDAGSIKIHRGTVVCIISQLD